MYFLDLPPKTILSRAIFYLAWQMEVCHWLWEAKWQLEKRESVRQSEQQHFINEHWDKVLISCFHIFIDAKFRTWSPKVSKSRVEAHVYLYVSISSIQALLSGSRTNRFGWDIETQFITFQVLSLPQVFSKTKYIFILMLPIFIFKILIALLR